MSWNTDTFPKFLFLDHYWSFDFNILHTFSAAFILFSSTDFQEYDIDPSLIFPAVVEPEIEGAFLTEHPRKVEIAPSNTVPVMVGITSGEGAMKSGRKFQTLEL